MSDAAQVGWARWPELEQMEAERKARLLLFGSVFVLAVLYKLNKRKR
jgi:hypothetical protein